MAQTDAIVSVPWYRTLNRDQWRVLIASKDRSEARLVRLRIRD